MPARVKEVSERFKANLGPESHAGNDYTVERSLRLVNSTFLDALEHLAAFVSAVAKIRVIMALVLPPLNEIKVLFTTEPSPKAGLANLHVYQTVEHAL